MIELLDVQSMPKLVYYFTHELGVAFNSLHLFKKFACAHQVLESGQGWASFGS
jgi:hypothetical protein